MRIQPINIQTQNKLIQDYRNEQETVMQHFDYNPFESGVFQKRAKDLQNKNVNREQLTEVLHKLNTKWNAPLSTLGNIERLKQDDSLVVIAGQQAGLLTGPMYTINKLISVIQLARQQEEQLGVPVIPVFWIAGEDHDFDEINHIYLQDNSKMKKHKLLQRIVGKKAVSDIAVDDDQASEWIDTLFMELGETSRTNDLYHSLKTYLANSETYIDFFAQIIFRLFAEEGLVLIDSNDAKVRKLESSYFIDLIERQSKTTDSIHDAFLEITKLNYSLSIESDPNDANLFYQNGEERVLLIRNDDGYWVGKHNEIKFTTEEMLSIAKNEPELLSNNVMTRPLMQEMVFPSLAFIGGPGEISYWSVLKGAFHVNNLKMPPVIPRLSFTFMERNVEKLLHKYDIPVEYAVNTGILDCKQNWLESKTDPPVVQLSSQLKQTIDEAHKPLRELAQSIRSDIGDLADKNLTYLLRDVAFLEKRMIKSIEEKYEMEIYEFDTMQLAMRPNGGLQERIWNPLPWINQYGIEFIKELTDESCSYEHDHYIVYL
ncbi:bacillithiol biosynthesis cysteine-adding enzyme BshC [Virgibacillus phasianinus]|uniref:Putative cysteine ligase BshC n=1 Tax=Virgibacillus phasianinus TaxID=2017483 RepID=A0A220U6W8_9BACI|nr:bacillithiol biosynthesis cysteine-adding enzyme BshC [Virgibacillus phasianinus]ASK63591.1 bacillithiol biosynthesis cysteine-adding enzyme BshC [Virgibacillus phasianinus]